jgi:hypothetical protein
VGHPAIDERQDKTRTLKTKGCGTQTVLHREGLPPAHRHEERFFASQTPLRMTSVELGGVLEGMTHRHHGLC